MCNCFLFKLLTNIRPSYGFLSLQGTVPFRPCSSILDVQKKILGILKLQKLQFKDIPIFSKFTRLIRISVIVITTCITTGVKQNILKISD